jgi:hypothetical protein
MSDCNVRTDAESGVDFLNSNVINCNVIFRKCMHVSSNRN